MDELVKLVAKKAGIPEKNAKVAVDTVMKFIEEKLPEPYGSRLEDIISGVDIGDLLGGLGGLLGK